jgi:hypothetical protein
LEPVAHAQFGSGVVYDPTQSVHAITQIEHEEQSISNQFQQIEQGQQIFSNTVKIATTALQAYNVAHQQYELVHQMILAPTMLYQRFLSPRSDLMLMQQISNTYGNSMGWLNASNTGNGASAAYQQVSVPHTANMVPGYNTASFAGQQQIAAQGATIDIGDSVMSTNLQALGTIRANQVARQTDCQSGSRNAKPGCLTADHHGHPPAHQSGFAFGTAQSAGRKPDQRQPCPATDGCPEAATGHNEVSFP